MSSMTSHHPHAKMVDPYPTKPHLNGNIEFVEDFHTFSQYFEELDSEKNLLIELFRELKSGIKQNHVQVKQYAQRLDETFSETKKRENEALSVVREIQANYDRNLNELKKSFEKDFSILIEKHKADILKWQAKFDKLKNDKKNETDSESEFKIEKHRLENKIASLSSELEIIKSVNETKEQKLIKIESQKKAVEQELHSAKNKIKENEIDMTKLKDKMKNLESQKNQSFANSDFNSRSKIDEVKIDLITTKKELETKKKELETKINILGYTKEELKDAKEKINELEAKLKEETKTKNKYLENLNTYKNDISRSKSEIERKENEIMQLKCQLDGKNEDMDVKLKEFTNIETKLKEKCTEFEKKNETLINKIELIKRQNADLKYDIDKKSDEIKQLTSSLTKTEKNRTVLQKVCEDLEKKFNAYPEQFKQKLSKQKSCDNDVKTSLMIELEELKTNYETLQTEKNELSNQVVQKECELQNTLTNAKNEFDKVMRELEMEQKKTSHLEDKVLWLEENAQEQERTLEDLTIQLALIKEEASKHITAISKLKHEKAQLLEELQSRSEIASRLMDNIELLQQKLESKNEEHFREKFYFNETLTQQKKLIEHICKSTESKKSIEFKPFKLHSESAEELKKLLKNEKEKNRILNEKLKETSLELEQNIDEVNHLKVQIDDLKNIVSKTINKKRIGTSNFEHLFQAIVIKFTTMCVSCAKHIYLGQKAKKCQKCSGIVHSNCSLINNCGLPLDLVRQTTLENFNNSISSISNDPSEIEPSAPEETSEEEIERIIHDKKVKEFSSKWNQAYNNADNSY